MTLTLLCHVIVDFFPQGLRDAGTGHSNNDMFELREISSTGQQALGEAN